MNQMNQQPVMNAWEAWPLYDTVCIGIGQSSKSPRWYESFAALAADTKIPFFNQRNRSSVGPMYNSFDSAEQISFGYECYSIGLEWYTPVLGETDNSSPAVAYTAPNKELFMELLRHASLRLQVGQDEKLLINALGAPGGAGFAGNIGFNEIGMADTSSETYATLSNGAPILVNRWAFAEPIEIPRNRNIQATVEFSNYAKNMLADMVGPGYNSFTTPAAAAASQVPACYMLRLSMFGKRMVQLRNELSF